MPATQLAAVSEKVVKAIVAADWPGLADCYAADVLLDMNLPTWRFQLQGRDTVREYFVEQTSGVAQVGRGGADLERRPKPLPAVVEGELDARAVRDYAA